MPPEIFTHIEGYEFRELLGQGGFGAVCKAIDKLGREVAIKVLTVNDLEGTQREASNKTFLKEATTLAKLNHPNIVTIYSFDIDASGRPYLVMEFLPGEPLSKIIRSGRQLHLVEKISLILQAARALQFAHSVKPQPVIHRDIKPQNLMIMRDGTVKLIDFGIAQVGGTRSRSMNIAGSLPYMSPEHWQPPLTSWADVFSLGVVFYELLTGTLPYATDEDTVPVAYQKIASTIPAAPLKQFLPSVPEDLEAVVAKVLSKQKINGYEEAQQFWLDLSRVYNRIKPDFISEHAERVLAAKNAGDFEAAFRIVEKLLWLDPTNHDVIALQSETHQAYRQEQRRVKVKAICERVEEALLNKKFDLAQLGLDEALQLAPNSSTVGLLHQRLKLARDLCAKIETLIGEGRKYQQAGQWKDAQDRVDQALTLDRANTLALNLRAEIQRTMAAEHQLCQDAGAALDRLQFEEALQLVRRAEAVAPQSEKVKALKEHAVTVLQEYAAHQEVEAALQNAQRLFQANDLGAARQALEGALAKYPDQRRLLSLRDAVELKLSSLQRENFVRTECSSAQREMAAGNPEAALTRLKEALARVPDDAGLLKATEQAKWMLARQAAEKRRGQHIERARQSLRAGDASAAIVTLEMALAEFANDKEIQKLLAQAVEEQSRIAQAQEVASREAKRPKVEEYHQPTNATALMGNQPPVQAAPVQVVEPEIVEEQERLAVRSTWKKADTYRLAAGALVALLVVAAAVTLFFITSRNMVSGRKVSQPSQSTTSTLSPSPSPTAQAVTPVDSNPKTGPALPTPNSKTAVQAANPAVPGNPASGNKQPPKPSEVVEIAGGPSTLKLNPTPAPNSTDVPPVLNVPGDRSSLPSLPASNVTVVPGPVSTPTPVIDSSPKPASRDANVVAPQVLRNPPPMYPPLAKGRVGVLTLKVTISKDGKVINPKLDKGNEVFLDAALEALRKWQYRPATYNGQAIEYNLSITMEFKPL